MLSRSERILENIPVGSLGIIPLLGCEELGNKVNDYLVKWRRESAHEHKNDVAFSGYEKDNYLINASVPRLDRKSTRLNSSHYQQSRMPSSA